jgi:hypothetical protein
MKTMVINFKGTVYFEFIQQGLRVNQTYYVETVKQLHEAVCRKKPELWPDWILHHDNALANESSPSRCSWPKN